VLRAPAAACVAAVLAAATLSGCGSPGTSAVPSGSGAAATSAVPTAPNLGEAVPWIADPAPPYQPPPAPKVPPPAADARACTAADVSVSWGRGNGAGGHTLQSVRFRNTSDSTCVLKGYPQITASEPGHPDVEAQDGSFFPSGPAADMAPGQDTLLGLETVSYCAAANPPAGGGDHATLYHHVAIQIPGGGTVTLSNPPETERGGFDLTCGLHLGKFTGPEPKPSPQPPDPLADLRASLQAPQTVQAGVTLVYIVALSNPTAAPTSLSHCPGYVEWMDSGRAVVTKELYALNCTPVGAIAAHSTVRFAMRLAVPASTPAGAATIHWGLAGPQLADTSTSVQITAANGSTPSPSGS
jgi:hypothetical protein